MIKKKANSNLMVLVFFSFILFLNLNVIIDNPVSKGLDLFGLNALYASDGYDDEYDDWWEPDGGFDNGCGGPDGGFGGYENNDGGYAKRMYWFNIGERGGTCYSSKERIRLVQNVPGMSNSSSYQGVHYETCHVAQQVFYDAKECKVLHVVEPDLRCCSQEGLIRPVGKTRCGGLSSSPIGVGPCN